jgi:hypothetical protein
VTLAVADNVDDAVARAKAPPRRHVAG